MKIIVICNYSFSLKACRSKQKIIHRFPNYFRNVHIFLNLFHLANIELSNPINVIISNVPTTLLEFACFLYSRPVVEDLRVTIILLKPSPRFVLRPNILVHNARRDGKVEFKIYRVTVSIPLN